MSLANRTKSLIVAASRRGQECVNKGQITTRRSADLKGDVRLQRRREVSSFATSGPYRESNFLHDREDIYEPDRDRTRRVVLKISGEALQGNNGFGLDPTVLSSVASEIAQGRREGYQIAVVVGGGNFFRGADGFPGIDRATADNIGMLATTMNAICLQSVLESIGIDTRLQTALEIKEIAEPYIRRRAIRHLEKGRVVIFGAGTGSPFFTTDTAAVLRGAEINADEVLKATKVQGVYTSDPSTDPNAEFLDNVSYDQALKENLQFMDSTALALCKERKISIRVFSMFVSGNISKAIRGDSVGTVMQHNEAIVKSRTDPASQLNKLQNGATASNHF